MKKELSALPHDYAMNCPQHHGNDYYQVHHGTNLLPEPPPPFGLLLSGRALQVIFSGTLSGALSRDEVELAELVLETLAADLAGATALTPGLGGWYCRSAMVRLER
jgi:hypothetical protein